jgi:hypothetical protein
MDTDNSIVGGKLMRQIVMIPSHRPSRMNVEILSHSYVASFQWFSRAYAGRTGDRSPRGGVLTLLPCFSYRKREGDRRRRG